MTTHWCVCVCVYSPFSWYFKGFEAAVLDLFLVPTVSAVTDLAASLKDR